MVLLGDEAQVLARFGPFGCTVRTIGSEIFLDAPNAHLGDEAQLVARFSPFGDSANLGGKIDALFALNVP